MLHGKSRDLVRLRFAIRIAHRQSLELICCDLKRGSNKPRDLKVRLEPLCTVMCGKFLRFGLRDLKSLAICDLEHSASRGQTRSVCEDKQRWKGRNVQDQDEVHSNGTRRADCDACALCLSLCHGVILWRTSWPTQPTWCSSNMSSSVAQGLSATKCYFRSAGPSKQESARACSTHCQWECDLVSSRLGGGVEILGILEVWLREEHRHRGTAQARLQRL